MSTGASVRLASPEREAPAPTVRPSGLDRALRGLHRWVWRDAGRRGHKLLRFAETEADGGRDLARAAERTRDPLLRRLYLRHASDEQRHARLFRDRGRAVLSLAAKDAGGASRVEAAWLAPGERGLDDLDVDRHSEQALLAFLHLSERAAARRFAMYHEVLGVDPGTRAVFADVLRDEVFHMNYTRAQLHRVSPGRPGAGAHLWWARLSRLWKAYLRIASVVAGVLGAVVLTVQYFTVLPIFALLARRAARRELPGWTPARPVAAEALRSQY